MGRCSTIKSQTLHYACFQLRDSLSFTIENYCIPFSPDYHYEDFQCEHHNIGRFYFPSCCLENEIPFYLTNQTNPPRCYDSVNPRPQHADEGTPKKQMKSVLFLCLAESTSSVNVYATLTQLTFRFQ